MSQQRPKISIIMPVYNAGIYLRPCVQAILNQQFSDFELIMVLDCPTDGSDRVAQELADQDARIVLLKNPENLHIGQSRNRALEIATGEYIAFSDHDDKVEPTWLQDLYDKAVQEQADIVVSDLINQIQSISNSPTTFSDKPYTNHFYKTPQAEPLEFQKGMLEAMICGRHSIPNTCGYQNANSIWNELFRADFLRENNLHFPDNRIVSYEDSLFNIQAFLLAKKVVHLDKVLYVHIDYGANTFSSYDYLSYPKIEATLNALIQIVFPKTVDATAQDSLSAAILQEKEALLGLQPSLKQWVGEAVMRRLYVALFNEYHFKGLSASWQLLKQWHKVAVYKDYLHAYQPLATGLSFPKRCFLRWIA